MQMLKLMTKWLLKFLSTLLQNIFATIVIGLATVPVLLSWATGTLDVLFQTIKTPTPLWATTALVLLVAVYIHSKTLKNHSPGTSSNDIFLMEDNGLKWKVTNFKNGAFAVERHPFCIVHDSRYVYTPGGQYVCREIMGDSSPCKSRIVNNGDLALLYNFAEVKAEKLVHNYKTKC